MKRGGTGDERPPSAVRRPRPPQSSARPPALRT